MIGTLPTVGCLVIIRTTDPKAAVRHILLALKTLVTVERQKDHQWLLRATLAGEQAEGLLFAQPGHEDRSTAVFVEFDEEATVLLTKRSGKPLDLLLLPFAVACQGIPEAEAIGIGFEMSVPDGFSSSSLENAGIAVFFVKNKSRDVWDRQDTFRLTGHTEHLLTYA